MVIDFAFKTLSKYALFWIEGLKPRTKQELLKQAGNIKYILLKDKAPDDLDQIAPSLTTLCLHSFSEQDEFQWYAILRLWSSIDSPKGAKMFPTQVLSRLAIWCSTYIKLRPATVYVMYPNIPYGACSTNRDCFPVDLKADSRSPNSGLFYLYFLTIIIKC